MKKIKKYFNSKGFTLVEILIVIMLIAVVAAIGFPQIKQMSVSNNVKKVTRSLTAMIQYASTQAVLKRRYYRLVIQFEPDQKSTKVNEQQMFWLESSDKFKLFSLTDDYDTLNKNKNKSKTTYTKDSSTLGKKVTVPRNVTIRHVVFMEGQRKISQTRAEIFFFFPEGRAQASYIQIIPTHLKGSENGGYTIHVFPIAGRVDVQIGQKIPSFED